MTVEQVHFALLPFLSGAALCALMIGVRSRSVTARKRRKTKLDLALIPMDDTIDFVEADPVVRVIPKAPAYAPDALSSSKDESESASADNAANEQPPPTKKIDAVVINPSDRTTKTVPVIENETESDADNLAKKNIFSAPMKIRKLETPQTPSIDAALQKGRVTQRRIPDTVKIKNRKVLLAEDMAHNRELITMFFDGTGIQFDFAETGIEAVTKFEANPNGYSLILMDIQMPEMDGCEAARMIRANNDAWAKQIPIIAMTADSMKDDIDACFDAGMDDHVTKPIDIDTLVDKVFDFITMNAE